MRMFLIGMCDIFLILYLTSITNVAPKSILTIDDFYKLKSIHETLISDQEKRKKEFEEKLRQAQVEKGRLEKTEQSLLLSDAERDRIAKDLLEKEKMLKAREQLLDNLNKEIKDKEKERQKMEVSYKKELASKGQVVEESREAAEKLQIEAQEARRLANQMQKEVDLAYKTAETAKDVQQKAIILKEQALKDKEVAERKANEALVAWQKIEEEKQRALEAMETAKANRKKAELKAQKLAGTIQDIKQDSEAAYNNNVQLHLQKLNVIYENHVSDRISVYERELTLLPVKIDGKIYVIFPSRQIGFTEKSDIAPDKILIKYQGKKVAGGWISKDDNLIAISLPGYGGKAFTPHSKDMQIAQFMPTLLSLRNDGNVSLGDKVRGISDDYFIVNRDYLKLEKDLNLKFDVPGFRGTGLHGERIVRGDQLVDLKGRLIGVANDANQVIRISTLSGWDEINF